MYPSPGFNNEEHRNNTVTSCLLTLGYFKANRRETDISSIIFPYRCLLLHFCVPCSLKSIYICALYHWEPIKT